jgi:hypothetical protein
MYLYVKWNRSALWFARRNVLSLDHVWYFHGHSRPQWRERPSPLFLSLEVKTVAVLLLTTSRRGVYSSW